MPDDIVAGIMAARDPGKEHVALTMADTDGLIGSIIRVGRATLPALAGKERHGDTQPMKTVRNEHFTPKSSYQLEELVECGYGRLFGRGNAKLPIEKMLMLDRITEITADGGAYGRGKVIASLDIKPDLWFFACHFPDDPVMPGCLGLDALWQMVGFFLGWSGFPGKGRALGAGEVKFTGEILPAAKQVVYELDISRIIERRLVVGIADGTVAVDGNVIYTTKALKVGLFTAENTFQGNASSLPQGASQPV